MPLSRRCCTLHVQSPATVPSRWLELCILPHSPPADLPRVTPTPRHRALFMSSVPLGTDFHRALSRPTLLSASPRSLYTWHSFPRSAALQSPIPFRSHSIFLRSAMTFGPICDFTPWIFLAAPFSGQFSPCSFTVFSTPSRAIAHTDTLPPRCHSLPANTPHGVSSPRHPRVAFPEARLQSPSSPGLPTSSAPSQANEISFLGLIRAIQDSDRD